MLDLPNKVERNLISTLSNEPSVEKAILFGSRARGDARPNSDIDIALIGSNISLGLNTKIRDAVGLYQVDIVKLDGLDNEQLKLSIERDGVVIYSREEATAN